jgi:hypothetical protein
MNKLLFAIMSIALLAGCKKGDNASSKRDILTAHDWRVNAMYVDGEKQTLTECITNYIYQFKGDNTGTLDYGAMCQGTNAAPEKFSWNLDEGANTLKMDFNRTSGTKTWYYSLPVFTSDRILLRTKLVSTTDSSKSDLDTELVTK